MRNNKYRDRLAGGALRFAGISIWPPASLQSGEEASLADLLFEQLPDDREEHGLQRVRPQPRGEAAPEEPAPPIGLDDTLRGLLVGDGLGGGLPCGLEHADGVGDAVAHAGGGDTEERRAHQLGAQVALGRGRQRLIEAVEGEEPRVVTCEGGERVAERTLVERTEAVGLDLGLDLLEPLLAHHLQRRLHRVARREQREHARVGRGVAEARERRLEERERDAAVEAAQPALLVQRGHRLLCAASVAVLVVHRGAQPHEEDDLEDAGDGTGDASAEGLLRGLLEDLLACEHDRDGAPACGRDCGADVYELRKGRDEHERGDDEE
eukprot:scaffold77814_cov67-Phaeocystis_antarctica.AAC.13